MSKYSKLLLVCLSLLTLSSCNKNDSSVSSQTSSNQDSSSLSTSSSSSSGSSSSLDSSSSSSINLKWSEQDLSDMKTYLNNSDFELPFPNKFTSNYVNASGTDEDGECFIVYDTYTNNTLATKALNEYSSQLIQAGLTKEDVDYEDIELYSYSESDYTIYVQIGIENTSEFVIYAYYEINYETAKDFPYNQIANFYNVSESEAKNIVPSFQLDTDKEYDYYSYNEDDIHYFFIGGYISTSLQSTIETEYETSLLNLGYTYNSTTQMYVNTSSNYEVGFALYEDYFFIQISKDSSSSDSTKVEKNIEIDSTLFKNVSSGYFNEELSFTKNDISFTYYRVMPSDSLIQFSNIEKGSGYLYNSTSLGKLTSIVIDASTKGSSYYGGLSLYVSDSLISAPNSVKIEPTKENQIYTYTISGNYSYFLLINESTYIKTEDETKGYASKNDSITINYLA